jgi:hypothetical protein
MLACLGTPLAAGAAGGGWEHTAVLYAMGAAIDGEAQIGDLVVPVDMSMSDIFDALEFGAMAAYRADNGTWSFTVDATFMGLGGTAATERGIVKGDLDLDQFTLMATVGRRVTPHLEALLSLAYLDLSTDLEATIRVPGEDDITRQASASASWVDPLIGLQYNVPIGEQWRFNLRGDVGGFGIGSDFTWQALANFRWQASERLGVVFGYRMIGFDYEDGHDAGYERYDLLEQGPLVGMTIAF